MNQIIRNAAGKLSQSDLIDVLEISEQACKTSTRDGFAALVNRLTQILPIRAIDVRVAELNELNGRSGPAKSDSRINDVVL